VKLAYADQSRTLNPENTVWEEILRRQRILTLGNRQTNSRAYVASFNFLAVTNRKK
jgi:ATPase subunit of ABC transporter with duplicated ATPase domains